MSKQEPFKIIMFSNPDEGHLAYWLKEAQKHGIGQKRFETLWFKAYNEMLARDAESLIEAKYFQLAELCVNKGHTAEIRNTGRKILNNGLKALQKRFEIKEPLKLLPLEEQPK